MAKPSSENERHRLLSGWCDGAVTDADIYRLDELVRTDPGFRDFYLKYMDQHAVLAAAVLPIGDVRLMVQCPTAACDEQSGRVDAVRAGSRSGFRDQRAGRIPRAWRRWIVVAAAALVLAGMIALEWPPGRPGPAIVEGPSTVGDPSPQTLRGWGSPRIRRRGPARRRRVGAGAGATAVGRRPVGGRSPRPPLGADHAGPAQRRHAHARGAGRPRTPVDRPGPLPTR